MTRTLSESDIASAMELSNAAHWNQTPEDWRRLLHLASNTCRCIEIDGQIAATAALLAYGEKLGWIGMVLTRPSHRRRGMARRLMEDMLAAAEEARIATLKLDATDEGRPLYESMGFAVEETVERWILRGGLQQNSDDIAPATYISQHLLALDREAFGADRSNLLNTLAPAGPLIINDGAYVLSRAGTNAHYLGPCIAKTEQEAREVITAQLALKAAHDGQQNCYWDILPANQAALHCAMELGFKRERVLWRMSRGTTIKTNNAMVYAIAGFELG